MRVYLDNCSFNRPFDDQSQFRIQLEAEAKLFIQKEIREGRLELAWSYILDYESEANPFDERRVTIQAWQQHATIDTDETPAILVTAQALTLLGLKSKDALHVACAIETQCDYFITTDDGILKKMQGSQEIIALDPTAFVREIEQ